MSIPALLDMTGELWRLKRVYADREMAAVAAPPLIGAAHVERLPGSSAANAWFTPDEEFGFSPVWTHRDGLNLLRITS